MTSGSHPVDVGQLARRADRLQTKLALVAEAVGLGNESVDRDRERGRDGYLLPTVKAVVARAEAFDALLSLVVKKAMIGPGGTRYPYNLGTEHRIWALFGEWRAGAESVEAAQEALKDVIRAALIEQAGGSNG